MPWGMWDYPRTYTGLLKGAGVLHERLLSLRPPAGAPHFVNETTGEQELDQARAEHAHAAPAHPHHPPTPPTNPTQTHTTRWGVGFCT